MVRARGRGRGRARGRGWGRVWIWVWVWVWVWAWARARARAGARVRARVRPRVTCGLFSCLRRFMALAPRPMKGPNSCPRLGTGVKVRLNTVRIGVAQHGKVKVRLKCVSSRPASLGCLYPGSVAGLL